MRSLTVWLLVLALLLVAGGCSSGGDSATPTSVVAAVASPVPSLTLAYTSVPPCATPPLSTPTPKSMPPSPPPTPTSKPTRTPTALPPTATPPPLGAAPADWDALGTWLADAWQDRRDPAEVRSALLTAGWMEDQAHWRNLELTGDLRDEWVLRLRDIHADPGYAAMWFFAAPGNLWIIGEGGLLYSHHSGTDILAREPGLLPELAAVGDMTGDGLPELVLQDIDCGAHTCYGYFSVIGLTREGFRNLVESGDPYPGLITLSYPDVRLVPEGDRSVFMIHSGTIGSAGAGIMRAYTEVWAWDGEDDFDGAVRWRETVWDPSEYRHHLLYEAMDLQDQGELARAEEVLTEVLEEPDLIVEPFGDATRGETEAAIAQFAGFRLVLTHLLRGDRFEAGRRAGWLVNAYPGAPLALAARHAVDGWSGQTGLRRLCGRLQAELETFESPTGPLENMGYGNPSITTAQLCTWGE